MSTPPVRYVTTPDGVDIAYTDCGEGQPFVFLPIFLNHAQDIWRGAYSFASLLDDLAGRFRLVNFDSRGMGMSTRPLPDSLSLDDYLSDLDTVVNELKLNRFILLGSCQSTFLGAHYAVRHPERVSALVLVNGAVSWNDWRLSSVYDRLPQEDWDLFLYNMVPQTRTPDESRRAVELLKYSMTQQDYLVSARVWQSAGLAPVLPGLHTPTLVLHSRDFRLRSVEGPMELARRLPNGRLVVMESNLLFGEPGQAMDAMTSFLHGIEHEGYEPDLPCGEDNSAIGHLEVAISEFEAMEMQQTLTTASALPGGRKRAPGSNAKAYPDGLSEREIEVLRLITSGKTNQQIADELVISFNTVQRHVGNILNKTSLANRTEAAFYAHRQDLI